MKSPCTHNRTHNIPLWTSAEYDSVRCRCLSLGFTLVELMVVIVI
ncbi:MAG: prepilin-type N-terminal cleavage/methylation domain-containing protein, partial [Nitrospirota bacterium]